ncbi:hypothetical protein [Morganella psychrotolerans]|uniref:hypothetical protein n=1 Tax=Morganella psychrotolerans TaxID=368603 RepID=UPI0012E8DADE|nr:hypothetical protein [Morganella psychrotolerans]
MNIYGEIIKKNSISFFDCINNEQCGKFSSLFEDDNGGSVTLMLTPTSSDKKVNVYLLYKSPVIKKINDDTKNNYNNEIMKKAESLADFL